VAQRIGNGHVLVIDWSAKGSARIERNATAQIAAGVVSVHHVAAEDFELLGYEPPFDLAFARHRRSERARSPQPRPHQGDGGSPRR
jgi:hypothetical protein